jgi:hypothetical protein
VVRQGLHLVVPLLTLMAFFLRWAITETLGRTVNCFFSRSLLTLMIERRLAGAARQPIICALHLHALHGLENVQVQSPKVATLMHFTP